MRKANIKNTQDEETELAWTLYEKGMVMDAIEGIVNGKRQRE